MLHQVSLRYRLNDMGCHSFDMHPPYSGQLQTLQWASQYSQTVFRLLP